jgi:hypothetical protein
MNWKSFIVSSVLALVVTLTASGQVIPTVGACSPAQAEAYLDVGAVRAKILNDGTLFRRGQSYVYEVPAGSGRHSVFSASFWVAGEVGGALRVAATRDATRPEFWPGPIPSSGDAPTDCEMYDRLWDVKRTDIQLLDDTGIAARDIEEWPWELGAPVVDGDGNRYNYDISSGDRPYVVGDQTIWAIMNDRGNTHTASRGDPLSVELRLMASGFARGSPPPLENQTVYVFRLRSRSDYPILGVRIGVRFDADLGNLDDDYVGTDTSLGLAYFYNADNFDDPFSGPETAQPGYGIAPPAFGIVSLRGPRMTDELVDGTCSLEPATNQVTPTVIVQDRPYDLVSDPPIGPWTYRNVLAGLSVDGHPVTVGGSGYQDLGPPTTFTYSGDPVTGSFWSEVNTDGSGSGNRPGDRRLMMGFGPFCLPPGGEEDLAVAAIWARGTDNLDSITELRAVAQYMRDSVDVILSPADYEIEPEPPEVPREIDLGISHPFPNPARETASVKYGVPENGHVQLAVFDALGRERIVLVDSSKPAGEYTVAIPTAHLETGTYIVRLIAGAGVVTTTLVVVR